jgi:hypothetical protein
VQALGPFAPVWEPVCQDTHRELAAIPHSLAQDKLKKVLTMIKLLPSASRLSLISSYLGHATR